MRKLLLQLAEVSASEVSNIEPAHLNVQNRHQGCFQMEKSHLEHGLGDDSHGIDISPHRFIQMQKDSYGDCTALSIDLKCVISDKALEFLKSNNSTNQISSTDDSMKLIQSILSPKDELNGIPSSPSISPSKAEKNRIAQQAYRKRRAEYINILEVRSSVLSMAEEQLRKTQEELAQVRVQLSECLKEKTILLNEISKLKPDYSSQNISPECGNSVCKTYEEKNLSDGSSPTTGSSCSSVKSTDYSLYSDLFMIYP